MNRYANFVWVDVAVCDAWKTSMTASLRRIIYLHSIMCEMSLSDLYGMTFSSNGNGTLYQRTRRFWKEYQKQPLQKFSKVWIQLIILLLWYSKNILHWKLFANPFLRLRSYPNLQVPFAASTPPQKYVEFLFVLFFVIWVWLMIAIKRIACINHIFSDANKIIICVVQKIFWHAQAQIHS